MCTFSIIAVERSLTRTGEQADGRPSTWVWQLLTPVASLLLLDVGSETIPAIFTTQAADTGIYSHILPLILIFKIV